MWSWVLHRATGIGILFFLFLHIVDIALIGWGPATFEKLLFLYRNPVFRMGEIVLFGAVLYHALNGIRITVIDFWSAGALYHRQLFWVEVAVFLVLFLPAAGIMFGAILRARGEQVARMEKARPAVFRSGGNLSRLTSGGQIR